MKNNRMDYEAFVQNLQQALLNSEKITKQKNIEVKRNVILKDNNGIKREFDLYWEYELAGVTYKTIIECKNYNKKISIEKIDSLLDKIKDFPDLKPVFATRLGYQKGAKVKAEKNGIELLIARKQNNTDFIDTHGNNRIKRIDINMQLCCPVTITKFSPVLDGKWIKNNTNIDVSKPLSLTERNDNIIIEDLEKGEKYSLLELSERLVLKDDGHYGKFIKEKKFDNAFIYYPDMKSKLLSYTIEYIKNSPYEIPIRIDFFKELIGVIEYLQKGTKTAIFNEKIIKNW